MILLAHGAEERRTRFPEAAVARLRALAPLRLNESGVTLTTGKLIALARGCRILVADRLTPIEAPLLAACPELVAVCRSAVDVRNIDLPAASAAGVLVTAAPPLFVDAVAELALGLMVDLARGVSEAAAGYRAGREPPARIGRQLRGSTLGVIGCGSIGRRLAELGLALGMEVLAFDPYVEAVPPGVIRCSLAELLGRADFVVCLAVATAETDRLLDARAFAAMKRSACFLNLARGSLVDEEALGGALREGRIAGAALDVGLDPGQMPPKRLAGLPNLVLTPHIGGLTQQAIEGQAFATVQQVAEILAGRLPPGALNPERAQRLGLGG